MNKIKLFAHLKEKAQTGELERNAAGKTVSELKRDLERGTSIGALDGIMVAVNEEFATEETVIKEGDLIALIPPVSGG